jgi:hypothetical protein
MDTRLAILLAASALLIASLLYFIASLWRSRRSGSNTEATMEPSVLDPAASDSLRTPLDLGAWVPQSPTPPSKPAGVEAPATRPSFEPGSARDDRGDDPLADELDAAVGALVRDREASSIVEEPSPPPAPVWEPDPELPLTGSPAAPAQRYDLEPALSPPPPVWEPAPEPEPEIAPAPEPEPTPVPEAARSRAVAEYRMVAPVELSFSEGTQRVGIRPGTATFLKYQRLAAVLLNDLKRTKQS